MKRVIALKQKRADMVGEMRSIIDLAEKEERELSQDEATKFTALEERIADIEKDIEREERLAKLESEIETPARVVRSTGFTPGPRNQDEFRSFGEFVYAIRFNQRDSRLSNLDRAESVTGDESRAQSMGTGELGGFAVPEQFSETLLQVPAQPAIIRPRATVISAGDPPDAAITFPALDQGAAHNIYGGVTLSWIAEGGAKPETDTHLREVKLVPQEVAGHIIVTDKLLRNWGACSSVLAGLLGGARISAEDTAFMSGNGIGKPLGFLKSPARIEYARAGASAIAYADIVGMYARAKMGGSLAWITSQTTIPQLTQIRDTGNNNLWIQSAVAGLPPTLMGIPVLFADRSPALGSTGDLCLVDLSYYLIKDGSGPFIAASEHVYFTNNKTVIKMFWNVDGQSWLNEPLPLEGSAANTVSPFVILK